MADDWRPESTLGVVKGVKERDELYLVQLVDEHTELASVGRGEPQADAVL